jgi:ectoine hydroxylase-related dioxygenase (phytanoyl-CoA dioxygenase family)
MRLPPALIDLSKDSLALVGKGGVVFHHSQTLHTSHRNQSDRWRRGYATHWVTQDVISENETLDTAYFRSEQYPAPQPVN